MTKTPYPRGKSQVFTAADIQLNAGFPGEGNLGESQEALGLFLEGIRAVSMTEVRTGKDLSCRCFGSYTLKLFVSVGKLRLRDLLRSHLFTICALAFKNPEINQMSKRNQK